MYPNILFSVAQLSILLMICEYAVLDHVPNVVTEQVGTKKPTNRSVYTLWMFNTCQKILMV